MPERERDLIQRWVTSSGAEAPLLVTGNGALAMAEQIGQRAVCETRRECNACEQCRMWRQRMHPDVTVFFGKGEAGGKKNVAKELRRVLSWITRTAYFGRRVVVLYDIEYLSPPALASLLKPLEEGGSSLRYIATAHYPQRLPETILSRCLLVRANGIEIAEDNQDPFDRLSLELDRLLRTHGPNPNVRRAFFRLRDYYQIKAIKGNVTLARQIVVAAVRQIDNTLAETYESQ